jgi:hypothetical protein
MRAKTINPNSASNTHFHIARKKPNDCGGNP